MFEEKDGLLKRELPLVSGKESGCSTVVEIGEGESRVAIGGGHFAMIAGPCSVESESQIISLAHAVKAAGANLLRGGAFKPRTSPYDFQGMGVEGLRLLVKAKEETGLPIVSEIMSEKYLDYFIENVDLIQIGSRNMQNFELLKALGRVRKPVMLKRGFSSTIREWLLSAEYLLSGGNSQVILCERGIRGFDSLTRNVLDLSAVPLVKRLSHLPVMVDPSHGTGRSDLVPTMAVAAVAAGADAIMVEVHDNPGEALSDGFQSLTPDQLADLCRRIEPVLNIR
ncbi:MAG: 3-deoxy-7-phosphoheptulonate synthase [Bacteroidales bacterium]|nr:3-deoxy-7-phosphoheptulonate synthase [Bacteroidales bacterium]